MGIVRRKEIYCINFSFSFFFSHKYILTAVFTFSPPTSPPHPPPLFPRTVLLPLPFRKQQFSQGYPLSVAQQDELRLSTNPYIKAGRANQQEEKGPKSPILEVPQEPQANQSQQKYRRSRADPCRLHGCLFCLCEALRALLS